MPAAAVKIDHDWQWVSGRRLWRNPDEVAAAKLLMGNLELVVAGRKRCGGRTRPRESGTGERDKNQKWGSDHRTLETMELLRRRNVTV